MHYYHSHAAIASILFLLVYTLCLVESAGVVNGTMQGICNLGDR